MKEKYPGDDPTGTDNGAKQEALDLISFNIVNILQGGEQGTVVDKVIHDISLKDIDNYLKLLISSKNFPVKLPLLTSSRIDNLDLFKDLCDYTNISDAEFPENSDPKIYFLESSDFAITFIPIQLDNNRINIHLEPLEDCPDFITEILENIKDGKRIEDIDFIDYKTLITK